MTIKPVHKDAPFAPFAPRHLGPSPEECGEMLESLGLTGLDELIDEVVPESIRLKSPLDLPMPLSERTALDRLRSTMDRNEIRTSFIGRGYHGSVLPPVIQRNVLENPGWYTAYTPYQAEISQGRLEAVLNFQTLVCELTALPVANASLLDEATAAAEAMAMCAASRRKGRKFFVSDGVFSQTFDVLRTRAGAVGIELAVGSLGAVDFEAEGDALIGALVQYPADDGSVSDFSHLAERIHAAGGHLVAACDPLALTLLKPPGAWGADIAVGSIQRFGLPLGFGGPHAAFLACTDKHTRRLPGRLVGVSKDAEGRPALRLSLQTREQHIRREKATSNICTAQVLLAVMAGFYAVYHGPEGLRDIARGVNMCTSAFARDLRKAGFEIENSSWFDTILVKVDDEQRQAIVRRCDELGVNLRLDRPGCLGVSFDEEVAENWEWRRAWEVFGLEVGEGSGSDEENDRNGDGGGIDADAIASASGSRSGLPEGLRRAADFLPQPVFHRHRSETEMLRYLRRLEEKDIALNRSMIPLGSCTMKLNATAEMLPLSWDSVARIHPFAPAEQTAGYRAMIEELEGWLAEITGFAAVSCQPNAGSQGEFAGLLAVRRYFESQGEGQRRVCLIPVSAHGTNPASAALAGYEVVPVACDDEGNIDLGDLREKAETHRDRLGALMVTYPSTHGVFEEGIAEICAIVHEAGGQVYLDGANLNAQVGLCRPGDFGADLCHLNLHKTFCIPHGGGGPGVGPVGVAEHLAPYLPGHGDAEGLGQGDPVSAAPHGSASILAISWMYLAMMGADGLTEATRIAILNANYTTARLDGHFPVLYRGRNGRVAHECIVDARQLKQSSGVDVEDIAKRLIDFGFHAPTMSWPVPGTLMIEPTESESKEELDRFCDAMIAIRGEIDAVAEGRFDPEDNPLKKSPHPAAVLLSGQWERAYSREQAAYPLPWVKEGKYWPPVSRVDNVHGDRNLVCTCAGFEWEGAKV